jgi:Flp pilus assembly pilin Flp
VLSSAVKPVNREHARTSQAANEEQATLGRKREQTKLKNFPGEMQMIKNFLHDETGLELSEYALAAALVALAVVGVFTTLGNAVKDQVTTLGNHVKDGK